MTLPIIPLMTFFSSIHHLSPVSLIATKYSREIWLHWWVTERIHCHVLVSIPKLAFTCQPWISHCLLPCFSIKNKLNLIRSHHHLNTPILHILCFHNAPSVHTLRSDFFRRKQRRPLLVCRKFVRPWREVLHFQICIHWL